MTNKKRIIGVLACLLLILMMCIAGYTFARYYESINIGTSSANIARWSFGSKNVETSISLSEEKIAPGSHGAFQIEVDATDSEVIVGYEILVSEEKSYKEVLKICKWLNFNTENRVFKGSTDYVQNGYNESNEAVEKIIEISLKNEKTYIMAIGAITNVALAIMKEPKIIDRIEIIWLGGHSTLIKDNLEFNFRQDVQAVRKVFESKVDLTIIPCKNVASNLMTTIYELEYHLKGKSELGDYLCKRFYNDSKHGIQTRRVLWDISVIAYLINKDWFETSKINCPNIKEDTSYETNTNNHLITMVNFLKSNKIYEDMFEKL